MLPSLLCLFLGSTLLHGVLSQSFGFTVYPQQVVTGLTYTVAWTNNGQPVTVDLLRNGAREDTLYTSDGTTNTFQWAVQDDYSGGTNYALRISSGGTTALVNNLYVIEDEDGLVVSGSTITAPSPTSTIDLAQVSTLSTAVSLTASTSSTNLASSSTISSPTISSTTSPTASPGSQAVPSQGLSGAAIAGVVIGVLGAAIVAGLGVWLCMRKRRLLPITSADGNEHHLVDSFLALGWKGGKPGTIKGTSPEVSNYPTNKHELDAGGIVKNPELPGESFAPWNAGRGRFYSDAASSEGTAVEPVRYEMSADNNVHN